MELVVIFAVILAGVHANCPELDNEKNTIVFCTNGTFPGSECGIDCEDGYSLIPEGDSVALPVVTCLDDDTWDIELPSCEFSCPTSAKADIVFLVDSSNSMRGITGRLMRSFLREMIEMWTISPEYVNVAIVPYNRDIIQGGVILLEQFANDKFALLDAISSLPMNGRGTSTGKALDFARVVVLSESNGNRPDAPDIVIVLSDGRGQDGVDPPLGRLWAVGVRTYAVGFHPRRMQLLTRQLMKIAQGNPSQMHLTDKKSIGNTEVLLVELEQVYCVKPAEPTVCDLLPPPPINGVVICSSDKEIGSECFFTCNDGFSRVGSDVTECILAESVAAWSEPTPVCTPDVCSNDRNNIENGEVICSNDNLVGSVCTFECVADFALTPRNRTRNTCQASTDWDLEQPCCLPPCPPNAKMDGIIVLDSSSSIGAANWIVMKRFVRNFLALFAIASDLTNFAVVRYNRQVDTSSQILLKDYPNDKTGLLNAFDRIPYDGSGTATGKAIQYVVDNMTTEESGNRPGVPDVVLVITDGKSSDNVLVPSEQLRAKGATVFAVGITPARGNLDPEQLLQIAGTDENVFVVEGFEGLGDAFALEVTDNVCAKQC